VRNLYTAQMIVRYDLHRYTYNYTYNL